MQAKKNHISVLKISCLHFYSGLLL